MAIFSAESTFVVADTESAATEAVTVVVTAPVTAPNGTGRLIHPIYGTYDYELAPDEWGNFDSDIVAAPVWAHTRTLTGAVGTQWSGYARDPEVYEQWNGAVAAHAAQLRMFLDMWQHPPTPPTYLRWAPTYVNNHIYDVQLVDISCGGASGINLNYLMLQNLGFVKGPLKLTYRIVATVV